MTELNLHLKTLNVIGTKSLGTPVGANNPQGSEASSAQNADLGQWYEQAQEYYSAVISGQEAKPANQDWEEFMSEMDWTQKRLGIVSQENGGLNSASPVGMGGAEPPIPQGASLGTMSNLVWTDASANLSFNGDARTQDIWSNDVNINVSSLSTYVTSEKTEDTRALPPEQVLKVTVTDKATGKFSVYFIHNYDDAHVVVNTPTGKIDQDSTGGLVQAGTYSPDATAEAGQSQATPFDKNKSNATTRIWDENKVGEPVQYVVTDGKELDKIYADTVNIVMPNRSDTAYVTKTGDHSYTIQILDENKKVVRTIKVEQAEHLNFDRAYAGNVFYQVKLQPVAQPMGKNSNSYEEMEIPQPNVYTAWNDPNCPVDPQVTVGGKAGGAIASDGTDPSNTSDPDTSNDTQLPANKKKSDAWYYDGNDLTDVSVTPTFDHDNDFVDIPGTFTLTPTDDQTVKITKDPSTKDYIITVESDGKKVTYHVNHHLTAIDLKINESKIKFVDANGNEDPNSSLLFDDKILIKDNSISQSNEARDSLQNDFQDVDKIKSGIKISGLSYDQSNDVWKGDIDWACKAAKDIATGMDDGASWDALKQDFSSIGIGQDNWNTAIRAQMLMGVLRSLFNGPSRDKKIKLILGQIFSSNPDLQKKWTDALAKSGNTATPVKSDMSGDWWSDSKDDTYQSTIDFITSIQAEAN